MTTETSIQGMPGAIAWPRERSGPASDSRESAPGFDRAWQREMERVQAAGWFPGALTPRSAGVADGGVMLHPSLPARDPAGRSAPLEREPADAPHSAPRPAQSGSVTAHAHTAGHDRTAGHVRGHGLLAGPADARHVADTDPATRADPQAGASVGAVTAAVPRLQHTLPSTPVAADPAARPAASAGAVETQAVREPFTRAVGALARGVPTPAPTQPAPPAGAAPPIRPAVAQGQPLQAVPSTAVSPTVEVAPGSTRLSPPAVASGVVSPAPAAAISPAAAPATQPSATAAPVAPPGVAAGGPAAAASPAAPAVAAPRPAGLLPGAERALAAALARDAAPRLHLSWDGSSVMVWLGMDGAPEAAVLLRTVQRVLRQHGLELSALVCNGRAIVHPRGVVPTTDTSNPHEDS